MNTTQHPTLSTPRTHLRNSAPLTGLARKSASVPTIPGLLRASQLPTPPRKRTPTTPKPLPFIALSSTRCTYDGLLSYDATSATYAGSSYDVSYSARTGAMQCSCMPGIHLKPCHHTKALNALNGAWDVEFHSDRTPAARCCCGNPAAYCDAFGCPHIDACEFFDLPHDSDSDTVKDAIWAHHVEMMEMEELSAHTWGHIGQESEVAWWQELEMSASTGALQ